MKQRLAIAITLVAVLALVACAAPPVPSAPPVAPTTVAQATSPPAPTAPPAPTTAAAQATATTAPQPTTAAPAPTSSGGSAQAQEITIGVVLPFTGALGNFGIGFREGVELAVDQMNQQMKAAGRNITFKTASADTTGTPDGAAKAFQTVVQTSGAQVVIGPLTTGEVLGAKQFADQNKIVILAPASTGMAGAIPNDYIFRVFDPPDNFAGQAFVGIADARGYKNVVVLSVDDPFGNGLVKIFSDGFKGGQVSQVKYTSPASDLSSEMSKVSAEVARLSPSGKTAFFCVCFLGDVQKALQQAIVNPTMSTVDWLGVENLRDKSLLTADFGPFLAKVNFTAVSFVGTQNPNSKPFADAYKTKFGKDPGPFTNYAYDAANIGMLSILVAGNNGEAVQKVLPFVADHYIGTEVQAFLDANGDQAIASYGIYRVKKDGADFEVIGTYDSSSGKVTFTTQ